MGSLTWNKISVKAVETSWLPTSQEVKAISMLAKVCWLLFRNSRIMIQAHFMQKGRTVTVNYNSEVILKKEIVEKLKTVACQASPKQFPSVPYCVCSHTTSSTVELINSFVELSSNPPYSPDFALTHPLTPATCRISAESRYLSSRSTL